MGLKNLARHMDGDSTVASQVEEANDAFDAPMMIMNQIHEA
jgi:hypothetical protein